MNIDFVKIPGTENRNTISVIIPTFRRWPYVLSLVEQLYSQTKTPDEIVVIDQTPELEESNAGKKSELVDRFGHGKVAYIAQSNPHVNQARNRGSCAASSEILLYLDDDVKVDRMLVEKHLYIIEDPEIDAVVGYTVDWREEGLFRTMETSTQDAVDFSFHFRAVAPERIERIPFTCGGHLAIRKRTLREIGGWDEHILTYGDKDLGLRLFKAGKNVVYDPAPRVVHLAAPEGGTRLTDARCPWTAWQRCVSIQYLAYRHLSGTAFWRFGVLRSMRHSFLLRRHLLRPQCWIREFLGWVQGFWVARRWAAKGPLCSFDL
jgi:GT2 family glycosyltransferase